MASTNGHSQGYLTLDALRAVKRLEDDIEIEGFGKVRVQALTQEEMRLIGRRVRDPDSQEGIDGNLVRQLQAAYGLVRPALNPAEDEAAALEAVQHFPLMVLADIQAKVIDLTFRAPSESYRDFSSAAGSTTDGAATASTSST